MTQDSQNAPRTHDEEYRRQQRRRARITALLLISFAGLIFAITIAQIKGAV